MSFTALDSFGNAVTSYTGPVTFSSTDAKAVFGTPSSFTNGVASDSVTLETVGTQTVKVKDSTTLSISGTSNIVTVSAAAASQVVVGNAPSTLAAGGAETVSITVEDAFGNVISSDNDKVTLSDSLGGTSNVTATLSSGLGNATLTLTAAGADTITVKDNGPAATLTGTSSTVTVNAGSATHLLVSASPTSVSAGQTTSVSITAEDQFGNLATGLPTASA